MIIKIAANLFVLYAWQKKSFLPVQKKKKIEVTKICVSFGSGKRVEGAKEGCCVEEARLSTTTADFLAE